MTIRIPDSPPSPPNPPHPLYRFLIPIPCACLLQAIFGLLYACGVFTPHFPAQYTISLGVTGFFTSIGITLSGIVMAYLSPIKAPVMIAMLGSVFLFAQTFVPFALGGQSAAFLYVVAAVVGCGAGGIYVASVDVLQNWAPKSPGRVTALGMLFGGTGTLLGIEMYTMLIAHFQSAYVALAVASGVAGVIAAIASLGLSRPSKEWMGGVVDEEQGLYEEETICLLSVADGEERRLQVGDILLDRRFYMLLLSFAASVGPGFGLVLAFQQMVMALFHIGVDRANALYFWVTLMGLVGRLLSGVAVDALGKDVLEGARKTNVGLLVAQGVALCFMPVFVRLQWLGMFTLAAAIVYVTFSGGPVVAACLTRAVFGAGNASLAFSLVAISIGMGDLFFSWVVAEGARGSYLLFVGVGGLWSVLGLGGCLGLRESRRGDEMVKERVGVE